MSRDEVIEKAKSIGWIVKPCAHPDLIAIRAYKPDTNEAMRMGANGEFFTRGEDGWMYQVGTVDDVANAIMAKATGESS